MKKSYCIVTEEKFRVEYIVYTFRGLIERGRDYHWTNGYSATTNTGFVLYPWMTKRECCQDAHSQGKKALFQSAQDSVPFTINGKAVMYNKEN